MRKILFRGKLTANGKWSEGNLVVNRSGVCVITPDETPIGTYGQVDPETVGQYTGLTDKNGKKIWEGDIVKVKTSSNEGETNEITRVGYDAKSCGFFPMIWETSCDGCDCYFRIKEIEIIGNIHDDPELLKGNADNVNL